MVFTLHAPSIMPIMKAFDSSSIRREFWENHPDRMDGTGTTPI